MRKTKREREQDRMAKKIMNFARPIMPPTWRVRPPRLGFPPFRPGYLHLYLIVHDEEDFQAMEEKALKKALEKWNMRGCLYTEGFLGRVEGPMNFQPIAIVKNAFSSTPSLSNLPRPKIFLPRTNPGATFAQVQLRIVFVSDWKTSLVHELAHVAVLRVAAISEEGRRQRKTRGVSFPDSEKEDKHGPIFQRAYRRMIIRTEKVYGKGAVVGMKKELQKYRARYRREKARKASKG